MGGHVVIHEREGIAAQMLNVLKAPGFEVVDADHPVAAGDQVVAEVRAEEPGSASYNDSTHLNLMVIGGRPWDNWPIDQVRPPRQVLALAAMGRLAY
jgi:hypothetical protein